MDCRLFHPFIPMPLKARLNRFREIVFNLLSSNTTHWWRGVYFLLFSLLTNAKRSTGANKGAKRKNPFPPETSGWRCLCAVGTRHDQSSPCASRLIRTPVIAPVAADICFRHDSNMLGKWKLLFWTRGGTVFENVPRGLLQVCSSHIKWPILGICHWRTCNGCI